jgi:hypothetical protein
VRWIDEVLEIALTARPVPRVQEPAVEPPAAAPKRRARARTPRPPQAH